MAEDNEKPATGIVIEDDVIITAVELCQACDLSIDQLMAMVEEGLIEPQGGAPSDWHFRATALRRVQVSKRLQRDLDINLAGAALVVDLLEEISELRHRLRAVESQLIDDD